MKTTLSLFLLAALLLSACQPIVAQPMPVAAEQAAAEQAFVDTVMAVETAFQSGDVDRIITYYAEDALSMPPGFPTSVGRDAIEADLRFFFEEFTMERDFTLVNVNVTGATATRLGEWTQTLTPKAGGDPIVETGRCVLGFKKVDGAWKVAWEIWNTYEAPTADAAAAMEPALPVMFYTSQNAHERFGKIDLATGAGVDVGPYANQEIEITRTGWPVGNGAIYEDAFYVIASKRLPTGSTPDQARSRLGRVDMQTGEVELIGAAMNLNLMALEIDHCGRMYATGFTLSNQLGEIFGDTNLYRVDREDGSLTLIGDTGLPNIMDLAFDPEGTLWATVGNILYTVDTETGALTEMLQITGVEEDHEIMGIGFTSEGVLYATTPFSDGFYTIDLATGAVTMIGRHGFTIPHGGDVPMTPIDLSCE